MVLPKFLFLLSITYKSFWNFSTVIDFVILIKNSALALYRLMAFFAFLVL